MPIATAPYSRLLKYKLSGFLPIVVVYDSTTSCSFVEICFSSCRSSASMVYVLLFWLSCLHAKEPFLHLAQQGFVAALYAVVIDFYLPLLTAQGLRFNPR